MTADDDRVGRIVDDRYRIDARLGEGSFAIVYQAIHLGLKRKFALKVLREGAAGARVKERFAREAETLAALSHPHIVTVTDFGTLGEAPYLVMELVDGPSLRDAIDAGPIPIERAIDVTKQILRAVAYAHAQGIVHRDLKPSNVGLVALPEGGDHVKILDFGFAKFFGEAARAGPELTAIGQAVGTPWYVAPEQVSAKATDGRADLYAIGAMLFEMLAGKRPYEGGPMEVVRAHLMEPVPSARAAAPERAVPSAIDAIVSRSMQKDPGARYPDATAMLAAIEDAAPTVAPADLLAVAEPSLVAAKAPPPVPAPAPREPETTMKSPPPVPEPAEREPETTMKSPPPVAEPAPARRFWPPGDLAIFAGVLVLLVVVTALVSSGDDEEVPETKSGPPEELVMDFSPAEVSAVDRAAVDPWDARVPEPIAAVAERIRAGERVEPGALLPLGRFAREHPTDARPHLLLAYAYVDKGWLRDAVPRYVTAFRVDPSCRGDARMLRDLVRLASGLAVATDAGQAIWTIWKAEKLPELERAAAAMEGRPEAARLRRLITEIRRRAARSQSR